MLGTSKPPVTIDALAAFHPAHVIFAEAGVSPGTLTPRHQYSTSAAAPQQTRHHRECTSPAQSTRSNDRSLPKRAAPPEKRFAQPDHAPAHSPWFYPPDPRLTMARSVNTNQDHPEHPTGINGHVFCHHHQPAACLGVRRRRDPIYRRSCHASGLSGWRLPDASAES